MPSLEEYKASHEGLQTKGFGPMVEDAYNVQRDKVVDKGFQFLGTPFFKGALAATALIVLGSAAAAIGWFATGSAHVFLNHVPVQNGLAAAEGGLNAGILALASPASWAFIGLGGLVGSGISYRAGRIQAEAAKEMENAQAKEPTRQPELEHVTSRATELEQRIADLERANAARPPADPEPEKKSAVERYNIKSRAATTQPESTAECFGIKPRSTEDGLAAYIKEQAAHAAASARG